MCAVCVAAAAAVVFLPGLMRGTARIHLHSGLTSKDLLMCALQCLLILLQPPVLLLTGAPGE